MRKLGDDDNKDQKAINKEQDEPDTKNWISVPNPDGVVREIKERRVVSREETEEIKETEDVQHLGDIIDEVRRIVVAGDDLSGIKRDHNCVLITLRNRKKTEFLSPFFVAQFFYNTFFIQNCYRKKFKKNCCTKKCSSVVINCIDDKACSCCLLMMANACTCVQDAEGSVGAQGEHTHTHIHAD